MICGKRRDDKRERRNMIFEITISNDLQNNRIEVESPNMTLALVEAVRTVGANPEYEPSIVEVVVAG